MSFFSVEVCRALVWDTAACLSRVLCQIILLAGELRASLATADIIISQIRLK